MMHGCLGQEDMELWNWVGGRMWILVIVQSNFKGTVYPGEGVELDIC